MSKQKLVDFNNPLFKTLLARSFKVDEKHLKHFVLPQVGDSITLGNVIYQISYIRENPFRFSASPIGILTDEEFENALKEATSEQTNSVPAPADSGSGSINVESSNPS